MLNRYHGGTPKHDDGKWQRVQHTGIGSAVHAEVDGWQIDVTHRQVGTTIRRNQYCATIRRQSPPYEEFLSGFATRAAATEAARKRIDLLAHVSRPVPLNPHLVRSRPKLDAK